MTFFLRDLTSSSAAIGWLLKVRKTKSRDLGYQTLILSDRLEGEARDVARSHIELARKVLARDHPSLPVCILSGGETTVTVRGHGKGGRNQEFALAAAIAAEDLPDTILLAAGTDGTDGPTDAAGAIIDGTTVSRAVAMGFDPVRMLEQNDAYPLLEQVGDLLKTAPPEPM
jgi:hydroxypyruvate reductase